MKLLLAGDSWGVGVFDGQGNNYGPTGQGLHTILTEQGYEVINISKAGGSNHLMIDRMEGRWGNTGNCKYGHSIPEERIDIPWESISHVVFFQTDIFREQYTYVKHDDAEPGPTWKKLDQNYLQSLLVYDNINQITDSYFEKFYSRLDKLAKARNKQILLIGGWNQLHPSINQYTNLTPAIPSATKLLIPELDQDTYLSDPEWYDQMSQDEKIMQKFGLDIKHMTIQNSNKLSLIYKHWQEVHPTLAGYQTITEQLLKWM